MTPAGAPSSTVDRETQGRHLADLIQEAGLDNSRLAKLAGVRRESISRVVNGHAKLSPRLAERVAPPLGVTVEELLAPGEPKPEARRELERRLRDLEDDRDYLLRVVRELLAHLDKMGVSAPHIPPPPRLRASARAPGLPAQDGTDTAEVAAGQRRPRLRRHR